MGNNSSFSAIESRYGSKGVDYVQRKYQERQIYESINQHILNLNGNANQQEVLDLEFLEQQKKRIEQAFNDGKRQAEARKSGSIQIAEAKHKQKIETFSGYIEQKSWIQNLEKEIRNKHHQERSNMADRVRKEVSDHKVNKQSVHQIPDYDRHPDNYRKSIESECIRKYPIEIRESKSRATDLQNKLTWTIFKEGFSNILDREKTSRKVDEACNKVKSNITGESTAVCC